MCSLYNVIGNYQQSEECKQPKRRAHLSFTHTHAHTHTHTHTHTLLIGNLVATLDRRITPCPAGALSETLPFRPFKLRFTPVLDAGPCPVRANLRVADVVRVQDVMEEEEAAAEDECLALLLPDADCLSNSLSFDASRHIFILALAALCSSSS